MTKYYINLYMEDRSYGGAEEGGWWYDYGWPVNPPWKELEGEIVGGFSINKRGFENLQFACDFYANMREHVKKLNEGRPETSSVLSQGRYLLKIEEHLPKGWPDKVPHYE